MIVQELDAYYKHTHPRSQRLIAQSLVEVDRDDISELTDSRLDLPKPKRRRRDFLTGSFLATLGEKQPAFPDSALKKRQVIV